jgi:hypothetical protein
VYYKKQAKWSVLKKRKSLSAQAHNIKTRKMVSAEKEREWLSVHCVQSRIIKNAENGWCQKRESHSLRRRITKKQGKWLVVKLRESLSVQAHNIKTRKMVGTEKEKVALCADA